LKKILFVCYGNSCRSPMAEGLGKFYLKNLAQVESAGLYPSRGQATPEAVELLRRYYKVDLSSHSPRSVAELELNHYDLIIALDGKVAERLKSDYGVSSEKIDCWEVPDPLGGSLDYYEKALNSIEKNILKLKEKLSSGITQN